MSPLWNVANGRSSGWLTFKTRWSFSPRRMMSLLLPWLSCVKRLSTSRLYCWHTRIVRSLRPRDSVLLWWTACQPDMITTGIICRPTWACSPVASLHRACVDEIACFVSHLKIPIVLFAACRKYSSLLRPGGWSLLPRSLFFLSRGFLRLRLRRLFWHGQVLMILTTQKWTD